MGRIRQSSDFNVSVSYSIVVYFSISPENYKIWTWYLVFWCPAVQWKKTKSYSFALLVKLKGATSCILMSHAFGSSTAAPKCHQNAMICFKARLLMRSAYATKDSSRTWKTSIQRKSLLRCTEYWNCKCFWTLCSQENIIAPFSLQPKGLNSWLSGKQERNVVCDRKLCLTSTFTNLAKLYCQL